MENCITPAAPDRLRRGTAAAKHKLRASAKQPKSANPAAGELLRYPLFLFTCLGDLYLDQLYMDIYSLLDEVQTIARNGLQFATNPYDVERYERLLTLASNTYSEHLDLPEDLIRERFANELGYITPKVGADAAIFNDSGDILLMERKDGSGWCLPCGWVEPN